MIEGHKRRHVVCDHDNDINGGLFHLYVCHLGDVLNHLPQIHGTRVGRIDLRIGSQLRDYPQLERKLSFKNGNVHTILWSGRTYEHGLHL